MSDEKRRKERQEEAKRTRRCEDARVQDCTPIVVGPINGDYAMVDSSIAAGRPDARRLLDDAHLLYQHERAPSALLLLLCAVDALAPRPAGRGRVRERFTAYLDGLLEKHSASGANIVKIEVPKTGELLTFGHILYTYMRNPLVHEGQTLDVRTDSAVAHVVLDFEDSRLMCRSNDPSGLVILGARWLIQRLFALLDCELKAEQGDAPNGAPRRR